MRTLNIGPAGFAALAAAVLALVATATPALESSDLQALLEIGGDGGPSWLKGVRPPEPLVGPAALGPSCRGLDVGEGVRDFVNRAASGGDSLRQQAHQAATSAVSSLPWITLRRALPEVADLFDAELTRAEQQMQQTASRCERDMADAGSGRADAEGWRMAARANAWEQAGRLAATPGQAEQMSTDAPQRGVAWIGGQTRGGEGQQPIRVITDASRAAAELMLDHQAGISPWESPQKAADWLVAVIGDVTVDLAGGPTRTEPGTGLWPGVAALQGQLLGQLRQVLDRARRGEDLSAQLQHLGSDRFGLHPGMLQALSRIGPGFRDKALQRMAYELALLDTLDRALLGRQLLLTALQLPAVLALAPAESLISERLAQLDRGIESLLFEYRARQSTGSTLSQIWQISRTQQ